MNDSRVEQLLEEGNALRREALAVQRDAVALQKEVLAAQRDLVERTRANLDLAQAVNQGAAALQRRARGMFVWLVPAIGILIMILVIYVAWLIFSRGGY